MWGKDDGVSVIKFSVEKDKEAASRQMTAECMLSARPWLTKAIASYTPPPRTHLHPFSVPKR